LLSALVHTQLDSEMATHDDFSLKKYILYPEAFFLLTRLPDNDFSAKSKNMSVFPVTIYTAGKMCYNPINVSVLKVA